MTKPKNRSYFPLWKADPYKVLSRKQVATVRKRLAKHGLKLPGPGRCLITTKVGGKFTNIVASQSVSTSEICSEVIGGKRRYVLHARPARSRR